MGYRDVATRVLCAGVNTTPNAAAGALLHAPGLTQDPAYYFYMCDMIPNAEHWRLAVAEAQELQYAIIGYLPGFATRASSATSRSSASVGCTCDGLRRHTRHLVLAKNYRTGIEADDPEALTRRYHYYDPIYTLT
jgi:lysine 2,3-aminomutase